MARDQVAAPARSDTSISEIAQRHLRIGWLWIAIFAVMGLVLETLHGFKVGAYLDVSNETRRLMWTLAHAHGTLFGVLHLGLAFTVQSARLTGPGVRRASNALLTAGVLLPVGFFLAGIHVYSGDPGIGIVFVPLGGVCAIYAAAAIALLCRRATTA